MKKTNAKGIRGCFLTLPIFHEGEKAIFRIYSEDKKTYKDYEIRSYDVFAIIDDSSCLIDFDEPVNGISGILTYPYVKEAK